MLYTPKSSTNINFIEVCKNVLENDDQCKSAWEAFTSVFRYKNPNTTKADDYNAFFIPYQLKLNPIQFYFGQV